MFVIHANLDAEARWAGGSLPGSVATRVSYYAALLSVLAPPDTEVEVWAPAAIDASRLLASPRWRPPAMRVGTPPRADLVWARPDAKAANDRRLVLAIARELDAIAPAPSIDANPIAPSNDAAATYATTSLPRAAIVETLDALVAWTSAGGRWVAKAPWTTAGRDRCHGDGAPTDEQRTRLSRLLAKLGSLVVEPWMDRIFDVGVCAHIDEFRPLTRAGADIDTSASISRDNPDFYVTTSAPHALITDARGTFLGIDLAAPALEPHEHTQLGVTARAVGARLAAMGFRGRFAIDAFVYRDASGARRLHPLCEINARHTFGHVARAFGTRLGFGPAPADATVLVAPANDGATAWIA